jgi:hypothetical protein
MHCGIEYRICHITGHVTEILRYNLKNKMKKEENMVSETRLD